MLAQRSKNLKILFAASEAYPLIKTGGLADVAASLYRSAMNGRVSAQIFWMKAMAARHEVDPGAVGSGDVPGRSARKVEPSDREVARRIAFMLDRAARSEGA